MMLALNCSTCTLDCVLYSVVVSGAIPSSTQIAFKTLDANCEQFPVSTIAGIP